MTDQQILRQIHNTERGYPGSKGGSGVAEKIISMMPEHRIYVETHLGSGAIMKKKRPASLNYGIDIDHELIRALQGTGSFCDESTHLLAMDAFDFLQAHKHLYGWNGNELIYSDPPYLFSVRSCPRRYYHHEYTEDDHRRLLSCLLGLKCFVMISGYDSDLYNQLLSGWHKASFQAMTRVGAATEIVWMNFDPVSCSKHEYTYVGANFRERERIKRKMDRWVKRLLRLPHDERGALFSAIVRNYEKELSAIMHQEKRHHR